MIGRLGKFRLRQHHGQNGNDLFYSYFSVA